MRWRGIVITIVALLLLLAVPAGAVKLTIWTMPHAGNPRWYDAGGQKFAQAHPGVEVEVVSGWIDKLFTMAAAGETPDLISYSSSELVKLIPLNMVADLGTYISKDPSFKLNNYLPPAVEALKYRGRLYGIPRQWSVVGLLYNQTRLEERGVALPDGSWTWDDLITNGKKLTFSSKNDGNIDYYAFSDSLTSHHRQPIWVLEAGGRYWNDDYTKSLLDSPEAERGLQYFVDLITTYGIAPNPTVGPWADGTKSFAKGDVAMTHNSRFARPSNPEYRWGVGPVVTGPAGRRTLTIVDFVSISSTTKHPELAWELAKYLCSEEGFDAGMELEPRDQYYWGLSPFRRQTLAQLEKDRDFGDHFWLTLLNESQPAPTFHPAGVNAVPNLTRVVNGEISLKALLAENVRTWNQQVADAAARGLKW